MDRQRSQILLDIERDLSRIKDRLNALEDHFEDNGLIARMAETLHTLAIEVERLKERLAGHAE